MAEEIEKEGGVVMDTPERTQIATPLSKFEDSPVFSYINSLSPIKPVKSMHITQTFSSLSFASLPSVFTSPHVSSLKESRFLRRHQFSDPLKPEPTSDNAKKASTSEGIPDAGRNPSKRQKDFDSGTENSVVPSYVSSNLEIELSGTFSYRSVRPDTNNIPEMTAPTTSIIPFVQDSSTNELQRSETVTEVIDPVNHNKEVVGCDWDSLISDASELLNFGSPSDTVPFKVHDQSTLDPTNFAPVNNTAKLDAAGQLALENASEKGENRKETAENHEILANDSLNNFVDGEPAENIDNEVGCNIYRGMRRRCLIFEMVGSRRKHSEAGSSCGFQNVSESNETIASSGKPPVPVRTGDDTSRCILPGIGLHLNALASTSVDQKVVKHEALDSGRQLIISPLSAAACQPVTSGQESSNKFSGTLSLEKDKSPADNEVLVAEDVSKALGFVVNDELLNQSSPKKKRRRVENAGESEACKRCNCKKSRCLKLYCECFAAGVYCVEPCSCQECFNKPIHEDTVLATRKQIESRNPLAFAPKVIRSSDSMLEIGDESSKTPASARHKRGCNCKKSGCLKKYCECYQGGVGCSINCRCEGCKNAFGRKDGSETDLEVNDGDECEGNAVDGSSQKKTMRNDSELISASPATPSRLGRQLIPLPITSKTKQRRSFLAMGSSSQRFGKLNPFQAPGKFDQQPQAAHEDEIPEILLGNNSSPIRGVKSSSPNGKRISPPHSSIGSSPGQKSSRKLILHSIPSFPSLTPKH